MPAITGFAHHLGLLFRRRFDGMEDGVKEYCQQVFLI